MVYKKYVRENGKIFGPYYYESYREGGKVKKRYIGTELNNNNKNLLLMGLIFVCALAIILFLPLRVTSSVTLSINERHSFGEILSGNLSLVIESGHYIDKDAAVAISLSKDGSVTSEADVSLEQFLDGQADYVEINDTKEVCSTAQENVCVNETVESGGCTGSQTEKVCTNETKTTENCASQPGEQVCTNDTQTTENCVGEGENQTCTPQTQTTENCVPGPDINTCTNETQTTESCSDVAVPGDCSNESLETGNVENCSVKETVSCENVSLSGYYYGTGEFSRELGSFINYSVVEPGEYSIKFAIPSLNIDAEKTFVVTLPSTNETLGNETLPLMNQTINNTAQNQTINLSLADLGIEAASISTINLNSTLGTNTTYENLTVFTNQDGNSSIKLIRNWYLNNSLLTLLNMPFEAGSNNTLTRDYALSNNGTGVNIIWNATGGHDGKGAYDFAGASGTGTGYISFSDAGLPKGAQPRTISLWLKLRNLACNPGGSGTHCELFDYGSASSNAGQVMLISPATSTSGVLYVGPWNSGGPATITTAAFLNTWRNIVWVFDGTNNYVYLDGVLNTSVGTFTTNTVLSHGYIGADAFQGYRTLNGSIDDVMVFNRSLSAAEVMALYQGKTNLIVSNELGLGDVWRADVIPNDANGDGATVTSNNLTIITPAYSINSDILSSSSGTNKTNENLTLTTDLDSNPAVKLIKNWLIKNESLAVLNMPFENGSNATFTKDYSAYSNNGSVSGATWSSSAGYDGKGAYQFTGTGGITIPNSVSLNPLNAVTVESWIFFNLQTQLQGDTTLFDHMTVNNWNAGTIASGTFWQDSQGIGTRKAVYNLNWSYDPSYSYELNFHYYVVAYGTACYAQLNLGIINLTYNRDGSCGGNGGLDLVDVTNKTGYVRTTSVNDVYGNHTWRLLYYNNGSYDLFRDGSYYIGRLITLPNARSYSIASTINNEQVQIDYINITRYIGSSANSSVVIFKNGSYEIGIYQNVSAVVAYGKINNNLINANASSGWNHIVLTYDKSLGSNQQKLYVNGTLSAQGTLTDAITQNTQNVLINSSSSATIDEVRIYNRSLSAVQISELYKNNTNKIVSDELHANDIWQACVTPNSVLGDSLTVCSNSLVLGSKYISASLMSPTSTFNVYNGTSFTFFSNVTCFGSCGTVSAYLDPHPVSQENTNLFGYGFKIILAIIIFAALALLAIKFVAYEFKIITLVVFGIVLVIILFNFVKITGFVSGGMISTTPAAPFYTTGANPKSCGAMSDGDICVTNWTVVATGNSGTYSFNSYYNSSDTDVLGVSTSLVNIVIQPVTPPALSIVSPSNTTYTNATIWTNISSGGYYTVYSFAGTNISYTSPIYMTYSEGSNRLISWANDTSGAANSTSVVFTVDTIPPTISIVSPGNITYGNLTVLVNISSAGASTWFFNGTGNETYTSPVLRTFIMNNNTLYAWTNDSAGNVNQTSVTFFESVTAPELSIISPTNITYNNGTLLLSISTFGDNTWFYNGTGNETYTGEQYKTFVEGSNTLYAWTNDSVGNINFSTLDFVVDTTSPNVVINSPTATTYTTATVGVDIGISETGTCEYSTDAGITNNSLTANSSNTGFSGTSSSFANGNYVLAAYCNDSAGNTNNTKKTAFTINVASAPPSGGGGPSGGGSPPPPVPPPETPPVTPPETPPVTPPETPPVTPPVENCIPNVICSAWGDCSYDTGETGDLFGNIITYIGQRTRSCVDSAGCGAGSVDSENCTVTATVDIKKENVSNEEKVVVTTEVTSATGSSGGTATVSANKTTAYLDLESWKQNGTLKIQFSDNGAIVSDNCFNGILDNNETATDCGGSCKVCSRSSAPFSIYSPWALLGLLSIGFIAQIWRLVAAGSAIGRKIFKRK